MVPEVDPADDGYHFDRYRSRRQAAWYTEWWYFAVTDPATEWAAAAALSVANPGGALGVGAAELVLAIFPPYGRTGLVAMDPYPLSEFSASPGRADVRVGPSSAVNPGGGQPYRLHARSRDAGLEVELEVAPADLPRALASDVRGYLDWEEASWLATMPAARATGTLRAGRRTVPVRGAPAYHDHNWGMWLLPSRTWSWAHFSSPEREVAFDFALHAAFWFSTAYLRHGDLRLTFPGHRFDYQPAGFRRYRGLWRYPTAARLTALDVEGRHRLTLEWRAEQLAALTRAPVLLFEQTARFEGRLERLEGRGWEEVARFHERGFFEHSSTWAPGLDHL
jgi:hypothetical protein